MELSMFNLALFALLACVGTCLLRWIASSSQKHSQTARWVLITGAARGFGLSMARQFAAQGVRNIVLVDLTPEALRQAMKELTGNSDKSTTTKFHSYAADVSDPTQIEAMVAHVDKLSEGRGLDVVVSNAGIVTGANIDELSPAQLQRSFGVNTFAAFYLAKALLPRWKRQIDQHPSHSVNKTFVCIASVMGMLGSARLGDYCATKWALLGFTETLRLELQRDGYGNVQPVGSGAVARRKGKIDVVSVLPFAAATGMFRGIFESDYNPIRNWLFKMLTADEVARCVVNAVNEGGDQVVAIPKVVYWLAWLQHAMPLWLQDSFAGYFGGHHGMTSFQGSASAAVTKVAQVRPGVIVPTLAPTPTPTNTSSEVPTKLARPSTGHKRASSISPSPSSTAARRRPQ